MTYLLVFLGGGLGAASRHAMNGFAARIAGIDFPWGTFAVNVLGSLAMGLLIGWLALRGAPPQGWRLFAATGFLGGFTTFSAFSLDAANMIGRGEATLAAAYVIGSVGLSVGALFAGLGLARL